MTKMLTTKETKAMIKKELQAVLKKYNAHISLCCCEMTLYADPIELKSGVSTASVSINLGDCIKGR